MALESTIVPVPSELVMPPAAYWAAQGQMSFWGVVAAGTAGSYVGSVINYFFFKAVGLPFVERYGRYLLLSVEKIKAAELWINRYGAFGVLLARFLPVIRHLISIPAGFFRMRFLDFSLATAIGAGLWCWVLAAFGEKTLGRHPDLLASPETMIAAVKQDLLSFVLAVVVITVLYVVFVLRKKRS